jgi:septum formation protein
MKNPSEYSIILASQSPRRSQLLTQAGFTNIEIRPTDTDETVTDDMPTEKVAEILATKKAQAASVWLQNDEQIIIAADTIVLLDGIIYGKPTDEADAFRIIRALSGKMHQVITGVCIQSRAKKRIFSEISNVFFSELSDAEIWYYIRAFRPFDKAGAYAIQEWIGHAKIYRIEGTYTNIMGLPVHRIFETLGDF